MKIGVICGNIGAGKSTVAEYLRKKGYPVINTDSLMKVIYKSDPSIYGTVTAIWGQDAIDPFGTLSREVRDLALKDEKVYEFLSCQTQIPLRHALGGIFQNLRNSEQYRNKTVFIESAVMGPWMTEWVRPEYNMDYVFRVVTPTSEDRLDRVVARYARRHGITTECHGFFVLPQDEYDKNKKHLEEFRKMVTLTDNLQNDMYAKWLAKHDEHYPEPVVMVNDKPEDAEQIANRIVEIVSK